MGPFAGADYNLTLSHMRFQSPAFHLNTHISREGGGEASPIGWAHLCMTANFHNMFLGQLEKKEDKEGGGKEGLWLAYVFTNIHFMEHWQPHA